ncbi:MAG: hypothetical protein O2812_06520, partial [Chloroflexi bacterium]|nr:hypothetical protein [Chloroflexota bacterium]
ASRVGSAVTDDVGDEVGDEVGVGSAPQAAASIVAASAKVTRNAENNFRVIGSVSCLFYEN